MIQKMKKIKKLRFWGTGAGEVIPSPFCRCRVCEHARRHGGKDVRLRSGFRLDEKVMLDLSNDFLSQAAKLKEDAFEVRHVLFSHVHEDHFDRWLPYTRWIPKNRSKRFENFPEPQGKLHLYFTKAGLQMTKDIYTGKEVWYNKDWLEFHGLDFYETYDIAGYKVTPLKGHHKTEYEANSANYLIVFPSGKTMYYALDSGLYLEETFEYLKNVKIDLLIGECTFLSHEAKNGGHMTLTDEKTTLDRLYAQGTIDEKSHIYLTHICGLHMTHDELCTHWENLDTPYTVNIAYDGLSVEKETNMF